MNNWQSVFSPVLKETATEPFLVLLSEIFEYETLFNKGIQLLPEAATGGVLWKKVFLKIYQNSQ